MGKSLDNLRVNFAVNLNCNEEKMAKIIVTFVIKSSNKIKMWPFVDGHSPTRKPNIFCEGEAGYLKQSQQGSKMNSKILVVSFSSFTIAIDETC